jgi:hypothetical protein
MDPPPAHTQRIGLVGVVPQSQLPVARGIDIPVGERLHPLLEPRALEDERGEGGRGHVVGRAGTCSARCAGGDGGSIGGRGGLRRVDDEVSQSLEANWLKRAKTRIRAPSVAASTSGFPHSRLNHPRAASACAAGQRRCTTPRLAIAVRRRYRCCSAHTSSTLTTAFSLLSPVNGAGQPLAIVSLKCCGASAH